MRAKNGFKLREVCGEKIVVAEGRENIDFSKIISMNESSAWLWEQIQGKEFDANELARLLCEEYEVDKEKALADSKALMEQWREADIVID